MTATTADIFGRHPFGLSADAEERAARLHRESVIVDLLFQGPCGPAAFTDAMVAAVREHADRHGMLEAWVLAFGMPGRAAAAGGYRVYEDCWRASGITAGTVDLEVGSPQTLLRAAASITQRIDNLPWLTKALNSDDIRRAHAAGQHALILNCQPVVPISRDLALIDHAVEFGLRVQLLTYNSQDHVGTGCTEVADAGLTRFGKRVVERLNERGVVVDTAHSSRRTTLDACAVSTAPVIASHTSARTVYDHARGKSDEELDAIAATGGVIGVYAMPFCLGPGEPAIDTMLDHIDHIAGRVGAGHVALGMDWPLPLPAWALENSGDVPAAIGFRAEDNISTLAGLAGFTDYRDMPNVTRGLVARGYSDAEIKGILGENFLRVLDTVRG
ncbi:dipeptidase [Streptomyces sp. NPDC055078]